MYDLPQSNVRRVLSGILAHVTRLTQPVPLAFPLQGKAIRKCHSFLDLNLVHPGMRAPSLGLTLPYSRSDAVLAPALPWSEVRFLYFSAT